MKILFVHNAYQERGGEDWVVEEEKRILEEHGHEVFLFRKDNADIRRYSLLGRAAALPRTVFSRPSARELRRVIKAFRPDAAHVFNTFPLVSPSAYWVLRRERVPVVQSINNFRWLCLNGIFRDDRGICELCRDGNFVSGVRKKCVRGSRLLSAAYAAATILIRKAFVPRLDVILVSNEFVRSVFVAAGFPAEKISVKAIPLPRPAVTTPLPREAPEDYLLYVGRLSREKGVRCLLAAARECPSVRFVLAGRGPEEDALKAYAREHRLPRVEFLGYVSEDDKARLLAAARALVFPTECYENFPVILMEAYAHGVPVIGSNLGATSALVEEGRTGLLFEPGDAVDLARKISILWASPGLRQGLSRGARSFLETMTASNDPFEKLMSVYRGLPGLARG
jgi:glycosyltransferase involved in cell wall biosynthesis